MTIEAHAHKKLNSPPSTFQVNAYSNIKLMLSMQHHGMATARIHPHTLTHPSYTLAHILWCRALQLWCSQGGPHNVPHHPFHRQLLVSTEHACCQRQHAAAPAQKDLSSEVRGRGQQHAMCQFVSSLIFFKIPPSHPNLCLEVFSVALPVSPPPTHTHRHPRLPLLHHPQDQRHP